MTWPWGTVSLNALLTVPTVSRASVTRCCASAWLLPMSWGTAYRSGPFETVKVTVDPRPTSLPAGGLPARTTPAMTVSLNDLTTLGFRWAVASAFWATRLVEPTTLGTAVRAPGPATKKSRAAAATTRTRAISPTGQLRPRSQPKPGRCQRRPEGPISASADEMVEGTTAVRDSAIVGFAGAPKATPGCRSSSASE